MNILKTKGIDWEDRRLILNLYKNQVIVKIKENSVMKSEQKGESSKALPVSTPLLYIYLKEMLNQFLDNNDNVRIGGRIVQYLKFRDDIDIIAESEDDLQDIFLERIQRGCKKLGMKINVDKTKVLWIGAEEKKYDILIYIVQYILKYMVIKLSKLGDLSIWEHGLIMNAKVKKK